MIVAGTKPYASGALRERIKTTDKRIPWSVRVVLATVLLLRFAAYGEMMPIVKGSSVKIGDSTYKVVDRIVLSKVLVFRKPKTRKVDRCLKQMKCIPGGRASYGILGCGPTVPSPVEPIAQIFARVPGKDAPNLFASIVGMSISRKRAEWTLEVALIACGPTIVVPVDQADQPDRRYSDSFNRISLSFSGSERAARLVLMGESTKPETYRVVGANEVVVFVVHFKSLKGLTIEKNENDTIAHTQSIDLVDGEYDLDSCSMADGKCTEVTRRDVVPAGHLPVPVIDSRQ